MQMWGYIGANLFPAVALSALVWRNRSEATQIKPRSKCVRHKGYIPVCSDWSVGPTINYTSV